MKKKSQKCDKITNKKSSNISNLSSAKNTNKNSRTDAKLKQNQNICDECSNNFESNELE